MSRYENNAMPPAAFVDGTVFQRSWGGVETTSDVEWSRYIFQDLLSECQFESFQNIVMNLFHWEDFPQYAWFEGCQEQWGGKLAIDMLPLKPPRCR